MGLPESFWTGWYTILAIITVFFIVTAIWYKLPFGVIVGICLGAAFVAVVTGLIERWFWWAVGALIVIGFLRLQINFERSVYKWTNGRPDNER